MSLASEMASAASEAQSTLAQLGGAAPDRNNSLYNGTPLLAVFGPPQVENVMLPSGGYRQRTVVNATLTRAQFTAPPASKTKLVRTDLTPPVTYVIDFVGTHDSYVYSLRLIRPGE